ncbi:hypothetical protein ACDY96_24165 [Rhizobium mongolense]|uniref:hypothetical protein n=1 Tax=Rhizobium mongolense TaxID=57676 RepID=UPI0035565CE1
MSSVECGSNITIDSRISAILVFASFGTSPRRFSYYNWGPPFGADKIGMIALSGIEPQFPPIPHVRYQRRLTIDQGTVDS